METNRLSLAPAASGAISISSARGKPEPASSVKPSLAAHSALIGVHLTSFPSAIAGTFGFIRRADQFLGLGDRLAEAQSATLAAIWPPDQLACQAINRG